MSRISVFSRISAELAAGLLCLAFSAAASAADDRPCADDAARLCKGVQAGQGRIARCLKQHQDDLSPACKARMAEGKEIFQACKADIKSQCAGVQRGGGRIIRCLRDHEADVSPGCRDQLNAAGSKAKS